LLRLAQANLSITSREFVQLSDISQGFSLGKERGIRGGLSLSWNRRGSSGSLLLRGSHHRTKREEEKDSQLWGKTVTHGAYYTDRQQENQDGRKKREAGSKARLSREGRRDRNFTSSASLWAPLGLPLA
jgi:hypothetical protein